MYFIRMGLEDLVNLHNIILEDLVSSHNIILSGYIFLLDLQLLLSRRKIK